MAAYLEIRLAGQFHLACVAGKQGGIAQGGFGIEVYHSAVRQHHRGGHACFRLYFNGLSHRYLGLFEIQGKYAYQQWDGQDCGYALYPFPLREASFPGFFFYLIPCFIRIYISGQPMGVCCQIKHVQLRNDAHMFFILVHPCLYLFVFAGSSLSFEIFGQQMLYFGLVFHTFFLLFVY